MKQKPLGKDLEHGRLVDESRVEHHVRLFLEWKDPFTFSATDTLPQTEGAFGGIDVLVNNAGGAPPVALAEASPRIIDKILALNLNAPS